ncbi:hypothetical protein [Streptomyces sp. VRA16 Mangrove soil]|uniref:hypothetical protein n=1 Tax=Streptomyces sp. VRA16 Mangrove soil TaxID=2817434 RepID=UPI001A9E2E19|nr:hypothetical protein [Streptomyces sp. VRA16 Mangrove soil]MBO1335384.1 hypothetical protein [Streptomyces sp. VRA16 Mangrove soil]
MSGVASRASSETPSSSEPVPAPIPELPGLGTTWYERGTRYRLRRIRTAVLMAAVMAFLCFAAISLYEGFRSVLPSGVRGVWDWAQVIASCGAVVWGWVVQRRRHRADLLDPPSPGESLSRKRAEQGRAVGLAFAGRALLVLAAPVMPAFAAFCVGWSAGMVTVHEFPSEAGARKAMEARARRT